MSFLSRLARARAKKKQSVKVAWLGLDYAGKTTLIRKVTTGQFSENTKRTLGLNVDEFTVSEGKSKTNDVKFISWDVGGQLTFRQALWNSYMSGSMGIIFVIDSSDESRFDEAQEELWKYIIENPLVKDIPILILANKQDIPSSKNAGEIARALKLHTVTEQSYAIFPCSAKTSSNMDNALEWLRQRIVETLK